MLCHAYFLGSIPDRRVFVLNRFYRTVFTIFHDLNNTIDEKMKRQKLKLCFKKYNLTKTLLH